MTRHSTLVLIDCASMDVTRWLGRSCTHRGYKLDVRPEDNFSRRVIEETVETFRTRPHNVRVCEEPDAA